MDKQNELTVNDIPNADNDSVDELNEDEISGDELNEDGITGDELNEDEINVDELNEDEISGDELNEDGITGDELNEDEINVDELNEDEISVDELNEGDITGNELVEDDLSGDLRQKPEPLAGTEGASSSDNIENDLQQAKKLKKKPWILGALILFLLVGLGAVGLVYYKLSVQRTAEPKFPTVTMPIPPITEVWLKDFLLPLKPEQPYACISFSIVIRSRDKGFIQKLSDQNQWLRAQIYDILLEKIQKEKDEPSLETLRQWLLQAFAQVMPASPVEGLRIHHFLLV